MAAILVVGADANGRARLMVALHKAGFHPREGMPLSLEEIPSDSADLLVADIPAGQNNGTDLLKALSDHPGWALKPVVLCATPKTIAQRQELQNPKPSWRILTKPAPSAKLVEVVRNCLGAPHLPSDLNSKATTVSDSVESAAKIASHALGESERVRLQATALETAANAIMITDRSARIQWVNPAFCTLTGYSADEVLGQNPRILKSGHHDKQFYKQLWSTLLRGNTWRGHFVNKRKDGTHYHDEHTITPVRANGDGEITHFVAIMLDITERKRAEDEVRRLNEELEQRVRQRTEELLLANDELEAFSYSVSHDLRAPLRAVGGFAHLLDQQYAAGFPPEARDYLGRIRTNANRMGQLIDGLLAFSRLHRQPLSLLTVPPTALARAALEELRPEVASRNVKIVVAELPVCRADPILLQQVFTNLISNALKYTRGRDPALIEIGSTQENAVNVYFVRDNGVGFDMKHASKLFRVFQRLHSPQKFEGTGIGLALVHRIVLRHGGRIWATAEVDSGATFSFTIGKSQ